VVKEKIFDGVDALNKQIDTENKSRDLNDLTDLIDCLDQEIEAYEDILKTVLEKQKLLVQNRESELEALLVDLNKKAELVKRLELKRVENLRNLGLENKNLTWMENCMKKVKNLEEKPSENFKGNIFKGQKFQNIPNDTFEIILKKVKRIKELILRVSEVNNSNVFLIEQGRKNIKAYLDLLFRQFDNDTYSNVGIMKNRQYKNIFLDKSL
jgi:flagellar biosynthesis/type III secretory pathway chaperone